VSNIAVITTFPNAAWDIYSKAMVESFCRHWPKDIPLMIALDDTALELQLKTILRDSDVVASGWDAEHAAFVERNKGRDDPQNYRKQAVRFCHKVFAIRQAMEAIKHSDNPVRYLIWMDGDVITNKPVTHEMLSKCLPVDGDAVAYLGRKDWDHSECGWLAFDLQSGGYAMIDQIINLYNGDHVFEQPQWHDSWIWDYVIDKFHSATNLTEGKPGRDIWQHSPMGKWSTHHKGPVEKAKMNKQQAQPGPSTKILIQTKNALPNEEIQAHIAKNQELIRHWVRPCKPTSEEVTVVSAGPMLVAEDVRKEKGRIVAVKNALVPLKKAGITPWACILLDPRPHVADFVKDADPSVLWFVASQVNPTVTMELLSRGCTVWGYHAAVNAGEEALINKQEGAIVSGGSATATRGLYLLNHLGFSNFNLYGYDLSVSDKPDLSSVDEQGQPKYFEMTLGMNDPLSIPKRLFWSEAQHIAQMEELNAIIKENTFKLRAHGWGMIPFVLEAKRVSAMRRQEIKDRIAGPNPPAVDELLNPPTPIVHPGGLMKMSAREFIDIVNKR
jgi:hypothetical protein